MEGGKEVMITGDTFMIRSLRFPGILTMCVLCGYLLGKWMAGSNPNGIAAPGNPVHDRPKPGPSKFSVTVSHAPVLPEAAGGPSGFAPVWDPWQRGGLMLLPESFFRTWNFNVGKLPRKSTEPESLNETLLKAIGCTDPQISGVQEAYAGRNEQLAAADVLHRKVVPGDNGKVEVEVGSYPDEAGKIDEEFRSRIEPLIGAEKAALLQSIIKNYSTMRENRGYHRRVYTLTPSDDGSIKVEHKSFDLFGGSGGTEYNVTGEAPWEIQHLVKFEAPDKPGNRVRVSR